MLILNRRSGYRSVSDCNKTLGFKGNFCVCVCGVCVCVCVRPCVYVYVFTLCVCRNVEKLRFKVSGGFSLNFDPTNLNLGSVL